VKEVKRYRPRIIVEIGVFRAGTSKRLIETACEYSDNIRFYGFDLFESADDETLLSEVSRKPLSVFQVKEILDPLGAEVALFEGKTTETLPAFLAMNIKPDFVFIDGGHSPETIKHDWSVIKKTMHKHTRVYFDDYIETDSGEDLGWGCKYLMSELQIDPEYEVRHLPAAQRFKGLRKRGTTEWNVPGTLEIVRVQHARILQPA
jgi:hypothetical protein